MLVDYSEDGDAWNYLTHDQARSRAYKRGEDGSGGPCDYKQRVCFALALLHERFRLLFVARIDAVLQAATAS